MLLALRTWLAANRLLAEVGLALALITGVSLLWHEHNVHEQNIARADWDARNKKALADAQAVWDEKEKGYLKDRKTADDKYAKDLATIPTLVISKPVWLRPSGEICSPAVSPATGQAGEGGALAGSGGSQQGYGINIRPKIEFVKAKYERALAYCRRLDASWPTH